MLQMQRYLSPGYKVKPKEEAKPKGRPPVKAAEGALDLGEKRPRACASREKEFEKRVIRELRRSVEVLPTLSSAASTEAEDRLQKVMDFEILEAAKQLLISPKLDFDSLEKAKQKLRTTFLRRKAQGKAKAKAKEQAKAKAQA